MSSGSRPPLRDQEPFATIRAHPKRFGWGGAAVVLGSLALGYVFAAWSLSLGIAVQLVLQTAGLLWLYLPVAPGRER